MNSEQKPEGIKIECLAEFLEEALTTDNRSSVVFTASGVAIGRNVIWCPYLNEPAFLQIDHKNNKLDCPNCARNYEPSSHPFICRILKTK